MSQSDSIQRAKCCECGHVHDMNNRCGPTVLDAFLAGYDVGYDDGRDDAYASKPFRRVEFERWQRAWASE